MGITGKIWGVIIAVAFLAMGVGYAIKGAATGPKNEKAPTEQSGAVQSTEALNAVPLPPAYRPYKVTIAGDVKYTTGTPETRRPTYIVSYYVESQKQPSENMLLSLATKYNLLPANRNSAGVISVLAIENRAWWPGKYYSIDIYQPTSPVDTLAIETPNR